jgi:acetoin utilization deacetylase AcuC-like enzyme
MMLAVGSTESEEHWTGPDHPERPARLHAALDGIVDAGLHDAVVPLAPRRATEEELNRVHDVAYLAQLARWCSHGGGHIDADTVVGPHSYAAAVLGAGAALAAVEALRSGTAEVGFVAARPPGHHATSARAMGFCLVNHVAVAAAALVDQGERVAIIDWDVHHGNGTQDIFWDDPRVLYVSTHQAPLYPGSGAATECGGPGALATTVNIPLPAGATGDVMAMAFDEVVTPAVQRFGPSWILVSAGFDAHRADPLADLQLSAGDFARMAAGVRGLTPAPGRLVFLLEGGYDLAALRCSVGAVLATALDVDYRPEPATAGGPGRQAVDHARQVQELLASQGGTA